MTLPRRTRSHYAFDTEICGICPIRSRPVTAKIARVPPGNCDSRTFRRIWVSVPTHAHTTPSPSPLRIATGSAKMEDWCTVRTRGNCTFLSHMLRWESRTSDLAVAVTKPAAFGRAFCARAGRLARRFLGCAGHRGSVQGPPEKSTA